MTKNKTSTKPEYKLTAQGAFVIENYNFSKPFANFFPGIAGRYGIPIWAFYVNRGQAVSSFGTRDKDHAILEFLPANKSWQMASLQGFRTFIKISSDKKDNFYEPFSIGAANSSYDLNNRMLLTSYDLKLEENNSSLGLTTKVEYFTVPNDNFGALARALTIKNTSKTPKKIQIIDGLPQIIPFGTNNFFLKEMSRTIEAWMNVENLKNGVPFYKLAVDPSDKPEVVHIKEGNFYLAFHYEKNKTKIIKPIVDPGHVFGPATDFTSPYNFVHTDKFHYPKTDILQSKTPCSMLFLDFELAPGQEKTLYSIIGYMLSRKILNSSIPKITKEGYFAQKRQENKALIEGLQHDIRTQSASPEFNLYAGQTYLDNILRGGYPVSFKHGANRTIFYLYSRKHGDLERDYNRFQIQPAYFSQGNGNYRDVNQNRRSDIWFNPEIKDENVIAFYNLLQADGFNPLIVKGATFTLKNTAEFKSILKNLCEQNRLEDILNFLNKPFTPGGIILFIEENKIKISVSYDEFLNILLSHCQKNLEAEHGEGFWTDHWTYSLDLLESYLGIYPEKLKDILIDKNVFTFYDNFETVKPRKEKYVIYAGGVKQLHSVFSDSAKKELLRKRTSLPHTARKQYGQGQIYQTTLLNKLLSLTANKFASLDPFGIGIEMESDKPNWYDALNGLPALSGSSICETFELKRLIQFIKAAFEKIDTDKVNITEEIRDLLFSLHNITKEYLQAVDQQADHLFWDKSHSVKEEYRLKTRLGFSGIELELTRAELLLILGNFEAKLDIGIKKALDTEKNVYCAYFINEAAEYQTLADNFVKPLKFIQKRLPFYLESQMHALRVTKNAADAKALHEAVKKSPLYDKKLKMYKVTAALSKMPEEIGRCRVFPPGWLENESIWLHMEYKYILELLRSGLYDDFYKEFKNVLIPFLKPETYGRSILENSSFIVSSAFSDKRLHGNGFVARLSGSTAEFLSIWLTINMGLTPFSLNEKKELTLRFAPLLAGWLFDKKGSYGFNLLGKIAVNYHNPKRKNTFGKTGAKISKITFNDKDAKPIEIQSDTLPPTYAAQIRERQISSIEVYFE